MPIPLREMRNRLQYLPLVILTATAACGRGGFGNDSLPNLQLVIHPGHLRFAARVGDIVPDQEIAIADVNDQDFEWRSSNPSTWVHLDPKAGPGPTTVRLGVTPSGLAPGMHRASVEFGLAGAEGSSILDLVVELLIEAPGWTELDGPHCGTVQAIGIDQGNPARVVVGGHRGRGLYVSDDGGASFTRTPLGLGDNSFVRSILLLPSGRGYAAVFRDHSSSPAGLYRSDDHGSTWSPTALQNIAVASVATDATAAAGDDIVMAEGEGLWRSIDGGASWSALTPPGNTYFVVRDPRQVGRFLLGGNDGLLYATTDGLTFDTMETGADQGIESFFAMASGRWVAVPVDSGGITMLYASDDEGASWERLPGDGLPVHVYSYDFSAGTIDTQLWTAQNDAYLSTDNGNVFQVVSWAYEPYNAAAGFHTLLGHGDHVLLGHGSEGLLRGSQGEGISQMKLFACAVTDLELDTATGILYGSTSPGGIFRYRPGAGTGAMEGLGGQGLRATDWQCLSLDPRTHLHLLRGGSGGDDYYRSTDGGLTWSSGALGMNADGAVSDLQRSPDNPDIVWVARGYDGVYRSTDGGVLFTHVVDTLRIVHVAPISADVAFVAGVSLHRYDANADSLTEVKTGSGGYPLDFVKRTGDGSLWCGDESRGLFRSNDEGATFAPVGLASQVYELLDIAVDPADPQHYFVATELGLVETQDGGTTYRDLGAPFPPRSLAIDGLSGTVYVGTLGGGLYTFTP